jgi:hypothetical protein
MRAGNDGTTRGGLHAVGTKEVSRVEVVFPRGRGIAFLVGHQSARLKRQRLYPRLNSTGQGYLLKRRTDFAAAKRKARGDLQAFRAELRNVGI